MNIEPNFFIVLAPILFFIIYLLSIFNENKLTLEYNVFKRKSNQKKLIKNKDIIFICLDHEEKEEAIRKMKMLLKAQIDAPSNKNKKFFIQNANIEKFFNNRLSYQYAQLVFNVFEEKGYYHHKGDKYKKMTIAFVPYDSNTLKTINNMI